MLFFIILFHFFIDIVYQEYLIIYSIYFYLFYFFTFIIVNLFFILKAQMLRC